MKKPKGNPPMQTLAAYRDYGLFSRIQVDEPNALEEMALVEVRTYSVVAKIHLPNVSKIAAARTVLRGHMIAFVHDGPLLIQRYFDEARIKGVLENIQIVFAGSAGKLTQLELKALRRHPELRM